MIIEIKMWLSSKINILYMIFTKIVNVKQEGSNSNNYNNFMNALRKVS